MAEIEPIKESKEFDEIRPKQSDPKLKAIFDELNKTVYNGKIPEIPIDWVENNVGIKGAMGGYCMDPENIMHVERSCILISKDIMDRVLRNCICHEMLHCRCHMQDVKRGVEVTSKKSNSHGNGNHNGLWKRLATLINKNHGIRIDQYYVDTTKSALKAAHQEWFRDDGEEYDFTFYKFNGVIMMQKIDSSAPNMDKFPVFHGRIPELNDVPLTEGNPFDDKYFAEKIASVYARPVDKYTKQEWDFIPTGDIYYTADKNKVEILFAMKNLEGLNDMFVKIVDGHANDNRISVPVEEVPEEEIIDLRGNKN